MGSSIDSIVECASRRPAIRFEIDRLGVGLLSSSAVPPKDACDPLLRMLGEDGRLLVLAELEVR